MITLQKKKTTLLAIALLWTVAGGAIAQTPHGWRGPTRNGIYPETGLLQTWPSGGPQLLWETMDAGKGYSSPLIVSDRLYVTGMNEDEDKEIFSAYSLDGKKIYEIEYGSPWEQTYPDTRTTPAIVGDKAYVISGSGEVVCINTSNGEIIWKVDGGNLFEHKTGNWGTAECPLVYDNKVIYTPGGDQTTMVALHAETGDVVWKTESLKGFGCYVSPILIHHNGVRQIIGSTANHFFGVNPDNGKIQWVFEQWGMEAPAQGQGGGAPGSENFTRLNNAINTPIYKDGRVFFSHGYDIGAYLLKLNDDATAVTLEWKNEDLDTHHGGQVLVNGTIYGSNHVNNSDGNWLAVDWETGETKYETTWGGGKSKGSIISVDGKLICYDERRGTVALVNPNPEKFDVVSEFRITKGEGPHWAHPVIHNGILYIRHGNALMAYQVK